MSKLGVTEEVHYTNPSTCNVQNFSLKTFFKTHTIITKFTYIVNVLAFLKEPMQEINSAQTSYMFTAQRLNWD